MKVFRKERQKFRWQPRIIVRMALGGKQGSPTESRRDFTIPFPVPASRTMSYQKSHHLQTSHYLCAKV